MNKYFNGLLYALCIVALVACGSSETTDVADNSDTDSAEETQSTDGTDTSDGTQTDSNTGSDDQTDVPETGSRTDGTDDGEDSNDNTTDGTDTTDNTDTTGGAEGFTCPEDDDLEDNDTNDTATVATPSSTWNGISCSIDGEYNHDNDVFVLTIDATCTLIAQALFTHANGDLDMTMTEASSGNLVGEGGQSEDDNEEITYTAVEDTEVFVSIFPFMSMGNEYVLNFILACP